MIRKQIKTYQKIMQNVILESRHVQPRVVLDDLSTRMGMERSHLVTYLPELEAYPHGNIDMHVLEDGNYHIEGDLATAEDPAIYYSPAQVQFYNDRGSALENVVEMNAPRVVEMPKKINVMLVREQQQEEPVYLVRDMYQAQSAGMPAEQVPGGVVRAVIKRPPTEAEMMATYDSYQNKIQNPRDEQEMLVRLDQMGTYQPHYVAHTGQHAQMGQQLVASPELHGYQPAHFRQMSHALQARNPLYLRNAPLAKSHRSMRMEDVLKIVLWVAVGILVGVLLGIYFT
jgi:hypothetical protein